MTIMLTFPTTHPIILLIVMLSISVLAYFILPLGAWAKDKFIDSEKKKSTSNEELKKNENR